MKILMGTQNPGKIEGAKQAFEKYFENIEIEGIAVDSEVGNQPFGDEVFLGAKNRVENIKQYAKDHQIKADYYIASEAGLIKLLDDWVDVNCAVVENADGFQSMGISPGFPIPERYILEIRTSELGKLMDRLFDEKELHNRGGGINYLTRDEISRIDLTRNAFIMALTKHINGDLWR